MGQSLRYDAATRKVIAVDNGSGNSGSSQAGTSWYGIKGQVKVDLLAFAKEDGLDTSSPVLTGKACNAYVEAAVKEFIVARKALDAAKMAAQAIPATGVVTKTVEVKPSEGSKPKPEPKAEGSKPLQPVASR